MDAARWRRVKEAYWRASEAGAADRAALLGGLDEADAALAAEVRALLAADADDPDFLERDLTSGPATASTAPAAAASEPAPGPASGGFVGPYRCLELLGAGGMGQVWRAVRTDAEVAVPVALKVLHPGAGDAAVAERVRTERAILARLDHPFIARILDGGSTADGAPYFVMELVAGERIDRHCDRLRLAVDDRLRLFRQVCAAVEHAHRNLVVHRDLKPANVLVTAEGVPKLLDFGIAKLLDGGAGAATLAGEAALTPAYASPEQVRGEAVTTQSDVYSLGVLLYELLTGELPYGEEDRSFAALARAVCETTPRPAVEAFLVGRDPVRAAERRETSVASLRRRLGGDLGTVVARALAKEPERRYGTARELAEDLEREAAGLPVAARAPSLGYRAARLLRRHRLAAAAALLLALALAGGALTTAREARRANAAARRAEARFAEARALARSILFDYHDDLARLAGATALRERLVSDTLAYLDRLASETTAGEEAALAEELAAGYEKVGDVQGHPEQSNLGDLAAAAASYEKALAIRRRLATVHPSAAAEAAVARTLLRLGDAVWWAGDAAGAAARFREAVACARAATLLDPGSREAREALALARLRHGYWLLWEDGADPAVDELDAAIALWRPLAASAPAVDPTASVRLAQALALRGNALGWLGEAEGSLSALADAQRALADLAAAHPGDPRVLRPLIGSSALLGEGLEAVGDPRGAIAAYRRALAIADRLQQEDPVDAWLRRRRAVLHSKLADALLAAGEPAAALAEARGAMALQEELAVADPANAELERDRGNTLVRVGAALAATGDHAAAAGAYREAVAVFEALAAATPGSAMLRRDVARSAHELGRLLAERRAPGPEACGWLRRAAAAWDELAAGGELQPVDVRPREDALRSAADCATAAGR